MDIQYIIVRLNKGLVTLIVYVQLIRLNLLHLEQLSEMSTKVCPCPVHPTSLLEINPIHLHQSFRSWICEKWKISQLALAFFSLD